MDPRNSTKSILIIHDYLYVFSEEFLSTPPRWEIEFSIELLLGTLLISKAPYRMGRAEL